MSLKKKQMKKPTWKLQTISIVKKIVVYMLKSAKILTCYFLPTLWNCRASVLKLLELQSVWNIKEQYLLYVRSMGGKKRSWTREVDFRSYIHADLLKIQCRVLQLQGIHTESKFMGAPWCDSRISQESHLKQAHG